MVKCYLLDEKIVYQSFYDAPLMFSYFLLQGKVLCLTHVGKIISYCKDLVEKIISLVIPDTIVHSNSKIYPSLCGAKSNEQTFPRNSFRKFRFTPRGWLSYFWKFGNSGNFLFHLAFLPGMNLPQFF